MVLHIDEDSWTSGFLFFFWANFCHLVKKIKIPGQVMQKQFVKIEVAKLQYFEEFFCLKVSHPI
jgi:hypothetical protein